MENLSFLLAVGQRLCLALKFHIISLPDGPPDIGSPQYGSLFFQRGERLQQDSWYSFMYIITYTLSPLPYSVGQKQAVGHIHTKRKRNAQGQEQEAKVMGWKGVGRPCKKQNKIKHGKLTLVKVTPSFDSFPSSAYFAFQSLLQIFLYFQNFQSSA